MALDSLGGAFQTDSLVVIGRDEEGRIRGFLHLVPVYGRTGVSSPSCAETATPRTA